MKAELKAKACEFLLQREGDDTWIPVDAPTVEILEGCYRILGRTRHPQQDLQVQISYWDLDEMPPQRHSRHQTRHTNAKGLVALLSYTQLKAGRWEIQCSSDFMADLSGEGWSDRVTFEVLPQEEASLDPNLMDGLMDAFQDEEEIAPAANQDAEIAVDAGEVAAARLQELAEKMSQLVVESVLSLDAGLGDVLEAGGLISERAGSGTYHGRTTAQGSGPGTPGATGRTADLPALVAVDPQVQIFLTEEVYMAQRGSVLALAGAVLPLVAETWNPRHAVVVRLELRDPETLTVLAALQQTLPPFSVETAFSFDLVLPPNCAVPLLLGEIQVCCAAAALDRSISETGRGDAHALVCIGRQSFSVTASPLDILEQVHQSLAPDLGPSATAAELLQAKAMASLEDILREAMGELGDDRDGTEAIDRDRAELQSTLQDFAQDFAEELIQGSPVPPLQPAPQTPSAQNRPSGTKTLNLDFLKFVQQPPTADPEAWKVSTPGELPPRLGSPLPQPLVPPAPAVKAPPQDGIDLPTFPKAKPGTAAALDPIGPTPDPATPAEPLTPAYGTDPIADSSNALETLETLEDLWDSAIAANLDAHSVSAVDLTAAELAAAELTAFGAGEDSREADHFLGEALAGRELLEDAFQRADLPLDLPLTDTLDILEGLEAVLTPQTGKAPTIDPTATEPPTAVTPDTTALSGDRPTPSPSITDAGALPDSATDLDPTDLDPAHLDTTNLDPTHPDTTDPTAPEHRDRSTSFAAIFQSRFFQRLTALATDDSQDWLSEDLEGLPTTDVTEALTGQDLEPEPELEAEAEAETETEAEANPTPSPSPDDLLNWDPYNLEAAANPAALAHPDARESSLGNPTPADGDPLDLNPNDSLNDGLNPVIAGADPIGDDLPPHLHLEALPDPRESLALEVVVEDDRTELGQQNWLQLTDPIIEAFPDDLPLPLPRLELPQGEWIGGQTVPVSLFLPETLAQLCVRLWMVDCQSRTVVGDPLWITRFLPTLPGCLEARFDLPVPEGCLEIQVEAMTVEPTTQRESHKISLQRSIVPAELAQSNTTGLLEAFESWSLDSNSALSPTRSQGQTTASAPSLPSLVG